VAVPWPLAFWAAGALPAALSDPPDVVEPELESLGVVVDVAVVELDAGDVVEVVAVWAGVLVVDVPELEPAPEAVVVDDGPAVEAGGD
jgi:hypothetical protein